MPSKFFVVLKGSARKLFSLTRGFFADKAEPFRVRKIRTNGLVARIHLSNGKFIDKEHDYYWCGVAKFFISPDFNVGHAPALIPHEKARVISVDFYEDGKLRYSEKNPKFEPIGLNNEIDNFISITTAFKYH